MNGVAKCVSGVGRSGWLKFGDSSCIMHHEHGVISQRHRLGVIDAMRCVSIPFEAPCGGGRHKSD